MQHIQQNKITTGRLSSWPKQKRVYFILVELFWSRCCWRNIFQNRHCYSNCHMNPSFENEETFTFPHLDWCTEPGFLLVEAGNKKKNRNQCFCSSCKLRFSFFQNTPPLNLNAFTSYFVPYLNTYIGALTILTLEIYMTVLLFFALPLAIKIDLSF